MSEKPDVTGAEVARLTNADCGCRCTVTTAPEALYFHMEECNGSVHSTHATNEFLVDLNPSRRRAIEIVAENLMISRFPGDSHFKHDFASSAERWEWAWPEEEKVEEALPPLVFERNEALYADYDEEAGF